MKRGASSVARPSHSSTSPGALETLAGSFGPVPHVMLRDTDPGYEEPVVKVGSSLTEVPGRYQVFGELARGGMGAVFKGAILTSAVTWPSKFCSTSTAGRQTWSAGSSRKPRSAGNCNTRGSYRCMSWGPLATGGRTSR